MLDKHFYFIIWLQLKWKLLKIGYKTVDLVGEWLVFETDGKSNIMSIQCMFVMLEIHRQVENKEKFQHMVYQWNYQSQSEKHNISLILL